MNTGLTFQQLQLNFKEFDLLKGRTKEGTYADTEENRGKGRVGLPYRINRKLIMDDEGRMRSVIASSNEEPKPEFKLTPEEKKQWNVLFTKVNEIRPITITLKYKPEKYFTPEVLKGFWKQYQPVAGETEKNINKAKQVFSLLEEWGKHWNFVNTMGTKGGGYDHSNAAMYLAKKYQPKIESLLEATKDLRSKVEKMSISIKKMRITNLHSDYTRALSNREKEEARQKEEAFLDSMTPAERMSYSMGYGRGKYEGD